MKHRRSVQLLAACFLVFGAANAAPVGDDCSGCLTGRPPCAKRCAPEPSELPVWTEDPARWIPRAAESRSSVAEPSQLPTPQASQSVFNPGVHPAAPEVAPSSACWLCAQLQIACDAECSPAPSPLPTVPAIRESRAPPSPSVPRLANTSSASNSCWLCARDGVACGPECFPSPFPTASTDPAAVSSIAPQACWLCANQGIHCGPECSPSPLPSPISEIEGGLPDALEPKNACWMCAKEGFACPPECSSSPPPPPTGPANDFQQTSACWLCARQGIACGPECSGSPVPSPIVAQPVRGKSLVRPHPPLSNLCAGCSKPGVACPTGCTSPSSERAQSGAANPCAHCGTPGAYCPNICARRRNAPPYVSICTACRRDGVACPRRCYIANVSPYTPSNERRRAAKESCLTCHRLGAHCPPSCRKKRTKADREGGSLPAIAAINSCWVCRRAGAHCPPRCRKAAHVPLEADRRSTATGDVDACWACRQAGAHCPPHCIKASRPPNEAGLSEAPSACWSCRRHGAECPPSCRDNTGIRNPLSDGRCWLCKAVGDVCGTPCDNGTAQFPASWAYAEESSCWLCADFPTLCPSECGEQGQKATRTRFGNGAQNT